MQLSLQQRLLDNELFLFDPLKQFNLRRLSKLQQKMEEIFENWEI